MTHGTAFFAFLFNGVITDGRMNGRTIPLGLGMHLISIGVHTDMADKVFVFLFAQVRRKRGGKEDRQHWVKDQEGKCKAQSPA